VTKPPQQEFSFNGEGWTVDPAAGKEARPAPPAGPTHDGMHEEGPGPLRRMMDSNFLAYASYVICDRAIPGVEDGLKPVQRRILYSLHERDDGRFIKVANIVGHTMQYHPHGDVSIADALVNLTNREYLIEGQGNFGNIYTGDPAAASRYIECRLTELARKEVFNDALTEFVPSYDGRNQEPVTLPCKLPLLLMLGAEGIAVGLSTRILPHNFPELLQAQIAILQKKKFIVYPDFQQGGTMDVAEYDDGNGRVRVRARIEPGKGCHLVIRELPYGQTTESVIASVEDAVRKKKVPVRSISDFTAESVEIELALSPGTEPAKAIEALYAFTACESSVSSRLVVIQGRRPKDTTVSEVLKENTRQLVDLLKRELELARSRLLDDFHAKTLAQIFIENRIYKRIEQCRTPPAVVKAVFDGLAPFRHLLKRDVTTEDVEKLLEIRIRRISLFDIEKNRKEIETILQDLDAVEKNLGRLIPYAIQYLKGLLKTYGERYPRRTRIERFGTIEIRELTATELQIGWDRESGYLGHTVKGDAVLECSSLDKIELIWKDGRYKVMYPPERLFVDQNLIYCAKYDRDRVMTAVYTQAPFTFIKRFTLGGAILNKDYLCTQPDSEIQLLVEGTPERLYLKYKAAKGQRIHQQIFKPGDVPLKGVKTRGNQMTAKTIDKIETTKPRWWSDDDATPEGRLT
jgi:topoisomerase-4 subunit A